MASRAVAILGLFLCMLTFIKTDIEQNTTAEPEIGKTTDIAMSDNKTYYSCPKGGWVLYEDDTQIFCIALVNKNVTFNLAASLCSRVGGRQVILDVKHKEDFVKRLVFGVDRGNFWIGLLQFESYHESYHSGFVWRKSDTEFVKGPEPENVRGKGRTGRKYCGYLSRKTDDVTMEAGNCDTDSFFICERRPECKPGYFGNKCEQECHCAEEPCGQDGSSCKFGCQRNWMGAACDKVKQDPVLKYYCINEGARGLKYAGIRIQTFGVEYRAIYGLTSTNGRGDWCESTYVHGNPSQVIIIRILVNDTIATRMQEKKCVGQKLGEDIFSWEIVMNEIDGILQSHDVQFNVTCDFSVAESYARSAEYSVGGQGEHIQHKLVSPESTQDDVVLQVTAGSSGEPIIEAALDTPIILEFKYALLQGSTLWGVRPYNCVASTPDGKHVKQLLDAKGCQVSGSPVQAFRREDDKKIRTPWFRLFTFDGATSVTFGCSFIFCFSSDCEVGCHGEDMRRQRDTNSVTDEVTHSTTRTIRVLPSIPAKGDSQTEDYQPARPPAAPPVHDMGPFVYINPVTCSLFLLILLVFLCMYIAFTRTLRKSVYDIRKEIEVKRSRDKFLHCGCLQQKDRDYVAP